MYAVVNEEGAVFYGEGTKPALFNDQGDAKAVAAWFDDAYGPLSVTFVAVA